METIRTYLDNLFAGLPEDERLTRAKEELLSTMEDKYISLKAEGKSENEAIGIVISQFGNIDELLDELEIKRTQVTSERGGEAAEDASIHLTEEEAYSYLRLRKTSGWMIGVGVLMCLLGPASLVTINEVVGAILGKSAGSMFGVISLLLFIAVGVMLFIVCGVRGEKYERYEDQLITLPEATKARLNAEHDNNKAKFGLGIGFGLALIIIGVCVVIGAYSLFPDSSLANSLSVSAMLTMIGLGVMLMCKSGVMDDSYNHLLNIEKEVKSENEKKVDSVFSSIFWPCVVIAYFIWSFVFHDWSISWIVFPIGGLIQGAVSAIIGASKKNN